MHKKSVRIVNNCLQLPGCHGDIAIGYMDFVF